MSDITLCCLVEDDRTPFIVIVSPLIIIGVLKKTIKEENGHCLRDFDAADLSLWKVRYF